MGAVVHLDHASRWPLRPEARQAWLDATALDLGDPERRYAAGRRSRDLLDRANEAVAGVLGAAEDDVVWTASGTEAIHLAVLGTARAAERRGDRRRHVVTSAVEHSAVLRACERLRDEHGYRLDVVGVDGAGLVDVEQLVASITEETLAVHLQHANHEVGAVQPTAEVAERCRAVGAVLHVDAAQSLGQIGLSLTHLGADLLSASGAKFGGLPGTGLLVLGARARIVAELEGDHRQRRRRSGTLDVAAVAATAVALHVAIGNLQQEHSHRELLRRHLRQRWPEAVDELAVHGPLAEAHPGIVAASALYVDGDALVRELDAEGFAVHSGSSCATGTGAPSHVLEAMGVLSHGHVRVSVGPTTSTDELDDFVRAHAAAVGRLRASVGMPA